MKKFTVAALTLCLLAASALGADAAVTVGIGIHAPVHRHRVQVCSRHYVHHRAVRTCHWVYR